MKRSILLILLSVIFMAVSCKKKSVNNSVDPRVPPDMAFKTGSQYVYKDTAIAKLDTILVGVIVTKTEDNLTSFNGSSAFDGNSTTTTFFNHHMTTAEYNGYTVDLKYYARNQAGTEAVTFSVVDRDGNITKKTITLTVQ